MNEPNARDGLSTPDWKYNETEPMTEQTPLPKPDDGGPAFPNDGGPGSEGMSLRDWFAGQEQLHDLESFGNELAVALSGPKPEGNWQTNPVAWLEWEARLRARAKYIRADAMLKARSR